MGKKSRWQVGRGVGAGAVPAAPSGMETQLQEAPAGSAAEQGCRMLVRKTEPADPRLKEDGWRTGHGQLAPSKGQLDVSWHRV